MQFILLLILLVGLRVGASDLDNVFQAFLASSTTTAKSFRDNSVAVQNLFTLYQHEFGRATITAAEEKLRFAAFNDTVLTLLKANQEGGKTYTIKLNKFADWTSDELRNLAGLRRPVGVLPETNAKSSPRLMPLNGNEVQSKAAASPVSFDYTTRVVFGTNTAVLREVKNQGQCGSCYAFAFVTLLEVQYAFQLKSGTELSEQQIVDCSTYDAGCNGGYLTNSFAYLKKNLWQINGATSYPYQAKAASCAFKSVGGGGVKFGALAYGLITPGDASGIQQALNTYGPLWASVFVGNQTNSKFKAILSTFYSYTSGVLQFTGCPTAAMETNHAVVIVGYGVDAATNIPYWKLRNSWSSGWGEQGYFRIRRGVNMCGIESDVIILGKAA